MLLVVVLLVVVVALEDLPSDFPAFALPVSAFADLVFRADADAVMAESSSGLTKDSKLPATFNIDMDDDSNASHSAKSAADGMDIEAS